LFGCGQPLPFLLHLRTEFRRQRVEKFDLQDGTYFYLPSVSLASLLLLRRCFFVSS
jgi:hypothetical protein